MGSSMESMGCEAVLQWLSAHVRLDDAGMRIAQAAFTDHTITGAELKQATVASLKLSYGISSWGVRLKIKLALDELAASSAAPALSSVTEHGDSSLREAQEERETSGNEPAPGSSQLPSAEELCGKNTGISLAGILYCIDLFRRTGSITDSTTTSDLCHAHIKPATAPRGWRDEPRLIDAEKRWYEHSYVEEATGSRHSAPPRGTRSMCSRLAADPSTARFVGRPTHFLSHAWLYKILNVVAGLQNFAGSLPADAPESFYWFDTFAIDEHASQDRPQEWWSTTFQQAIEMMGHTVMVLSPWDAPQPLTRSWCLWELYCTYNARIPFSVCLGPDERRAFEAAILEDPDVVFDAFSKISVKDAKAGTQSDEDMIRATVEEQVGFSRLNAIAFEQMRNWIFGECRTIAAEAEGLEDLWKKAQIANLMHRFKLLPEAKELFHEVFLT